MMTFSEQFHVFHGSYDFSSDQLDLITAEVKKRQHTLSFALKNLQKAVGHIEQHAKPVSQQPMRVKKKQPPSQLSKKSDYIAKPTQTGSTKVLKGRVSYKVKGPGGRLMNIAEIKRWVDSLYDGEQGIVKQ